MLFIVLLVEILLTSSAEMTFDDDPECLHPDVQYPTVIEPNVIRIREGAALTLTCQVESRCRQKYNASDLYIVKKVPETYANSTRVRRLSDWTIQIHLADVHQQRDKGLWMCLVQGLPGTGLNKYTAHVQFVRRPLVPIIKSCVVDRGQLLTCSWLPSYHQQLLHTMDRHFAYKFIYSKGTRDQYCVTSSPSSCVLHVEIGSVYNLTIRAQTTDNFEFTRWMNFNTSLYIRPGAPTNLTMSFHNQTHQRLEWTPQTDLSELHRHRTYNYSVHIATTYQTSSVLYTLECEYIFAAYPNTQYNISVRAKPKHGGFWSEKTEKMFTTQSKEPEVNPEVFPSGYEITDKTCAEDKCKVNIFWKPLTERQTAGPGFAYEIRARQLSSEQLFGEQLASWSVYKTVADFRQHTTTLSVDLQKSTQVLVRASNMAGYGPRQENLSGIWINPDQKRLKFTEKVIIQGTGDVIEARIEGATSDVDHSATYTLFWRHKGAISGRKGKAVDWTVFRRSVSGQFSVRVRLPSDSHQYVYGLAKTKHHHLIHTSGLVPYTDCLYKYQAEFVAPPVGVEIVERSSSSLSVRWAAPPCDDSSGYITAYHVFYCIKDRNLTKCKEPQVIVDMEVASDVTFVRLTGLTSSTEYVVYVSSQSYTVQSTRVPATGNSQTMSGLSVGAVVGLLLSSVVLVALAGLGLKVYWRCCLRLKSWYREGIVVRMPSEANQEKERPKERKQSNLHPTSKFLLRDSATRGRFSVVTSDIYGDANCRQTDDVCRDVSDDDDDISPRSSDSGRYSEACYLSDVKTAPSSGSDVIGGDPERAASLTTNVDQTYLSPGGARPAVGIQGDGPEISEYSALIGGRLEQTIKTSDGRQDRRYSSTPAGNDVSLTRDLLTVNCQGYLPHNGLVAGCDVRAANLVGFAQSEAADYVITDTGNAPAAPYVVDDVTGVYVSHD